MAPSLHFAATCPLEQAAAVLREDMATAHFRIQEAAKRLAAPGTSPQFMWGRLP
jgi:hypothetical protein